MTITPEQRRAAALAAHAGRIEREMADLRRPAPPPVRRGRPRGRVVDGRCRPVICIETGRRFPSLTLAADHLGCHTSHIWYSIRNGWSAAGFHFRRAEREVRP